MRLIDVLLQNHLLSIVNHSIQLGSSKLYNECNVSNVNSCPQTLNMIGRSQKMYFIDIIQFFIIMVCLLVQNHVLIYEFYSCFHCCNRKILHRDINRIIVLFLHSSELFYYPYFYYIIS